MREYFLNLDTLDPLFHALVVARLRELEMVQGLPKPTIDDLTEDDELKILRRYCVTLYKEYRSLRKVFLENIMVSASSVRLKYSRN
jgi:hypothetical protein